MTEELIAHIKREERFVGHPYLDAAGLPTIGYGRRIPTMDHPWITEPQAYAMLLDDIRDHERHALALSPGLADEPVRRLNAITDFVFNLGPDAYRGSILRLVVNQKNWEMAARQITRWDHAGPPGHKVQLAGLTQRRAIEADWLLHPTDTVLPPAA